MNIIKSKLIKKLEEKGYKPVRENSFYWCKRHRIKDDAFTFEIISYLYIVDNKIYEDSCDVTIEAHITTGWSFYKRFNKKEIYRFYLEHLENIKELKEYE